jgi:putative transposase
VCTQEFRRLELGSMGLLLADLAAPGVSMRRRCSRISGVREDGQKVLLAIKSIGGESSEAWRTVLDDLINRGLRRPEFLIVDGAPDSTRRNPPRVTR